MTNQTPTNEQKQILQYLRTVVTLVKPHPKLKYRNIEDLVLQHGIFFAPGETRPGVMKECFRNTAHRTFLRGETGEYYCEGYALPATVPLPVLHAWSCTSDGDAFENTWQEPALAYFGIPIRTQYAAETALRTGYYGILDSVTVLENGLPKKALPKWYQTLKEV